MIEFVRMKFLFIFDSHWKIVQKNYDQTTRYEVLCPCDYILLSAGSQLWVGECPKHDVDKAPLEVITTYNLIK